MSTLDNLRKGAKRWLKALSAGDHGARERFRRAYPDASAEPGLRDVQHALAREHGYDGWSSLRRAHDETRAGAEVDATGGRTHAERVATFLEFACWDHHVHGQGDHAMHGHAAKRLLDQHPEIARDSLYTAVVCGDVAAVERRLSERPQAARGRGGPRAWTPLLYLCYTRFPHRKMLELLMRYGARVPDVSKWGPFYYLKHYEIAAFLLANGMNANHRNCHHTTLLHEMARMGDLRKARLLLEHGAAIDAIDQEFRSTPLGLAARWGQREMVGFLLEWAADPNTSGAPWATPLAWARKKGHADIETDLRRRGAQ